MSDGDCQEVARRLELVRVDRGALVSAWGFVDDEIGGASARLVFAMPDAPEVTVQVDEDGGMPLAYELIVHVLAPVLSARRGLPVAVTIRQEAATVDVDGVPRAFTFHAAGGRSFATQDNADGVRLVNATATTSLTSINAVEFAELCAASDAAGIGEEDHEDGATWSPHRVLSSLELCGAESTGFMAEESDGREETRTRFYDIDGQQVQLTTSFDLEYLSVPTTAYLLETIGLDQPRFPWEFALTDIAVSLPIDGEPNDFRGWVLNAHAVVRAIQDDQLLVVAGPLTHLRHLRLTKRT